MDERHFNQIIVLFMVYNQDLGLQASLWGHVQAWVLIAPRTPRPGVLLNHDEARLAKDHRFASGSVVKLSSKAYLWSLDNCNSLLPG
jgi:hypothetical protein